MFYKIEINLDNAAFGDRPGSELSRILQALAEGLDNGILRCDIMGKRSLLDFMGNVVGWAKVTK